MKQNLLQQLRDKHPGASEFEITKLLMKEDMASFAMICFSEALFAAIPDFHYEIYDILTKSNNYALEGKNLLRRLAIAAPRGSAKSTIFSLILPLHTLLTKGEDATNELILMISESGDQARRLLGRLKDELTENEKLRLYYGDWAEKSARKWTEQDVILKDGSRIVAAGTRQRVRGAIQRNTRVTLAIFDDIESELNANTSEERDRNSRWITNAVLPTLDTRRGRAVMIGTVIHNDCFLMNIKDKKSWHVFWYAAKFTDENGVEQLLWKDKITQEFLDDQYRLFEDVGNIGGYYQEFFNQPMSPEEAPFKPHYIQRIPFKYVRKDNTNYIEREINGKLVLTPVLIYGGVDLASTISRRADYTVSVSIAIDSMDNHYFLPYFRIKSDPATHPQMVIDEYKKYRHTRVQIESVAYQEACRSTVRKLMFEKGMYIPGLENKITHKLDKSRNLSLVPIFAQKKFFFLPTQDEAISEFISFPLGSHDDIVDATYIALLNSKKPRDSKRLNKKEKQKAYFRKDWMTA